MKKVVRLTEKDLTRLVKKIIKEGEELETVQQTEPMTLADFIKANPNINGTWVTQSGVIYLYDKDRNQSTKIII